MCDRLADRAEHEAGESAAAAGANDEQPRVSRLVDQDGGRMSGSGDRLDLDVWLMAPQVLHAALEVADLERLHAL